MANVLTVTANTLVDFLAVAPWQAGMVNRVDRFHPVAGGKGVNVARVLARHGHTVVAAGFAGGASGELLRERILVDGLVPALVATQARTRLGFQVVAPGAGRPTAVLEGGFPVTPAEAAALAAEVERRLGGTELVVVGGSVPDATCRGLYAQVLAACARAGVPCWVDAYGPAMHAALECPTPPALAKPNRDELAQGGRWQACAELHVTGGAGPVAVRTPAGTWRVVPPPTDEVNPVGSGDCYLAGLAHGRLSGWAFEDTLRYAAAAGAANAARADVAAVSPAEIMPLVGRVRVEPPGPGGG